MPLNASEPRSQDQRQFSSFVSGLNELNEPNPGTVTKPASKNSRISGSKSVRDSVSSSKKREALNKLELARQQKAHNEERIREEQEIERLRHLKLIADDQRRVEAAELEAALYHSDATEDELSCSSNDNLSNAPKYKDNLFKNGPATTFQSKLSHLSTTKTTSFFRALPTLDSTRNMALLTFYDRKLRLLSDLLLSHFKLVGKKVWLVTVLTIILLFPKLLVLLLQHSLVEKIKLVSTLRKLT